MTRICTCFCVPPLRKKTSNPAERFENDKWLPSDSNFFFGRVECNHCLRYLRPFAEQNRSRERERERERDRRRRRSKLQLARRWVGCGGVAGRVKGTWDFGTKPTYLMQFSQTFLFYGLDSVVSRAAAPKTILSRKKVCNTYSTTMADTRIPHPLLKT